MRDNKRVKRLIEKKPLWSISPDETTRQACRIMKRRNVEALAVMEGDKLVGMISDRDVVMNCVGEDLETALTPVRDVMNKSTDSVNKNDTIGAALSKMLELEVRHLPVQFDGKVLSVLSIGEIVEDYKDQVMNRFAKLDAIKKKIGWSGKAKTEATAKTETKKTKATKKSESDVKA